MFEEEIIGALQKSVTGEIVLEVPPDSKLGDFAFPCFSLAKTQKKSPVQIAQELAKSMHKPEIVSKIAATGPYVNFFLDPVKVGKKIIAEVVGQREKFGSSNAGMGEVVAIDYSSPNIGKPFHFGHLRSTIIGESLGRMLEFRGFKVERLNYVGDWGTQFGAMIYAFLNWGSHVDLKKGGIMYLVSLYVRFHEEAEKDPKLQEKAREWFVKLEKGDKQAVDLWGLFKSHSLAEFKRIYDVLGVKFDSYNGESYYARLVDAAIEHVRKKGVAELHEGALIVRLAGFESPLMLRKSDESSTYASRDVATILDRVHVLGAKKVLYVVGHEQSLHFQQLFALMDLLGHPKENFAHISFGLYVTPEGKLSTRKGRIILMEDVLKDAIGLALKTIDEKNPSLKDKDRVARSVGVGAIIFGDLLNDRQKDVMFDLNKILSFEGDTGPYLMYTHARAASIIVKAREQKIKPAINSDFFWLKEDVEHRLVKLLTVFPSKIADAAAQYKPHILAQYLIELGRTFNEFYHACPCLSLENQDLKLARLTLVEASRQVLHNGLHLLGIVAPFEM